MNTTKILASQGRHPSHQRAVSVDQNQEVWRYNDSRIVAYTERRATCKQLADHHKGLLLLKRVCLKSEACMSLMYSVKQATSLTSFELLTGSVDLVYLMIANIHACATTN